MKIYKTTTLAVTGLVLLATGSAIAAEDYSDHRAVLAYAEYITAPGSDEAGGITVFQRDSGNGQLGSDFVFNDPRRAAFNDEYAGVNYAVNDANTSSDGNLSNQTWWMRESFNTWTNLQCSDTGIVEIPHNGTVGVVEKYFKNGFIIEATWGADVTQAGFRSAAQFPFFAANPNVLGVAFTLTWVDGAGNPTDIDNNGKSDVAFREIYYNDEFEWADNGAAGTIDFPTVAIHEVGHGLSAAHFGMIALQKGQLIAKPRAIMNAIYGGTLRDLTGRDKGSHCSNWAQWPNN